MSTMQGYLRRAGKPGKGVGLRRKRFYRLHGAIFSKHLTEGSEPAWDVNVLEAEVVQLGRTHFVISLKLEKEDENSFHADFEEENTLILYARTEEECRSWVSCLRQAANRRLENHYEVGPVIGEGGFAVVRVGRCLKTGKVRAIKTMKKNEEHIKLYGREVAIIKRVDHPNIVKTFDCYETSSKIHIVMEYMEGGMLYEAIEDGKRFKEEDTAQVMRELLDGIHYLHQQGIVHRDIKPENVLCTSKEPPFHVKIADFGLSTMYNVKDATSKQMMMKTLIGTPEFIAPEIAKREPYTEKVDMWALGMLCYNVICGDLPIDEYKEMLPQLLNGVQLTFPEPEWAHHSDECISFIRSLICYDPSKRLCALGGLVHPWLEKKPPKLSIKIGAHGRVSKYLLEHESFVTRRRNTSETELVLSGSSFVGTGGGSEDYGVIKLWKKGYCAIVAMKRLEWGIYPDRFENAIQRAVQEKRKQEIREMWLMKKEQEMASWAGNAVGDANTWGGSEFGVGSWHGTSMNVEGGMQRKKSRLKGKLAKIEMLERGDGRMKVKNGSSKRETGSPKKDNGSPKKETGYAHKNVYTKRVGEAKSSPRRAEEAKFSPKKSNAEENGKKKMVGLKMKLKKAFRVGDTTDLGTPVRKMPRRIRGRGEDKRNATELKMRNEMDLMLPGLDLDVGDAGGDHAEIEQEVRSAGSWRGMKLKDLIGKKGTKSN